MIDRLFECKVVFVCKLFVAVATVVVKLWMEQAAIVDEQLPEPGCSNRCLAPA